MLVHLCNCCVPHRFVGAVAAAAAAVVAAAAVAVVAVGPLDVGSVGPVVAPIAVVDDVDWLNADDEVSVDLVWRWLQATRQHHHAHPKHLDGAPTLFLFWFVLTFLNSYFTFVVQPLHLLIFFFLFLFLLFFLFFFLLFLSFDSFQLLDINSREGKKTLFTNTLLLLAPFTISPSVSQCINIHECYNNIQEIMWQMDEEKYSPFFFVFSSIFSVYIAVLFTCTAQTYI